MAELCTKIGKSTLKIYISSNTPSKFTKIFKNYQLIQEIYSTSFLFLDNLKIFRNYNIGKFLGQQSEN